MERENSVQVVLVVLRTLVSNTAGVKAVGDLPFGPLPEFPYIWLVRVPFAAGAFVVLCFVFLVAFDTSATTPTAVVDLTRLVAFYLILIPGLMQFVSLPVAAYVLAFGGAWRSAHHWLAVSCGAAQLGLSMSALFTEICRS